MSKGKKRMTDTIKRSTPRRAWVKPEVRPMVAGAAEIGTQRIRGDGGFTFS